MTNEWVKGELYGPNNDGNQRRYTIADGVSVSQGALLQLLDGRTVSYSILAHGPVAGVAAEDHYANQGVTSISCWTDGVFRAVASFAITAGTKLVAGGVTNQVFAADVADIASSYAVILGTCYDTVAKGGTCSVRLLV
jgi:hypothetical protein